MNFNQLIIEALSYPATQYDADEGDYIIIKAPIIASDTDNFYKDIPLKAGTVCQVTYLDLDDMGCYYVHILKDKTPGIFIDEDQDEGGLQFAIGYKDENREKMVIIDKDEYERVYTIKNKLSTNTKETFGDLIDEL
jgi:hypothetical protein